MHELAEYVSRGHPDRLADAIVKRITCSAGHKTFVALECAIFEDQVFIDGRVAYTGGKFNINNEVVSAVIDTYKEAGYNEQFLPSCDMLKITSEINSSRISKEERELRIFSDDQNIVTGYALNSPETKYVPVAHYVAIALGNALNDDLLAHPCFGPDFKLLVDIKFDDEYWSWHRLTISALQANDFLWQNAFKELSEIIRNNLNNLFNQTLPHLSTIKDEQIFFNGGGDFVKGGPYGDNGLSGKKLAIDFYGPTVPIGGGAIYGKDIFKVDVCGAIKAREFALELVKKYHYHAVQTELAWSPGEEKPHIIQAYEIDEFGFKNLIPEVQYPPIEEFSIENINKKFPYAIYKDLKVTESLMMKIV